MKRFALALFCCVVPGCSTDLTDDNASVFDDGDFGDAANAGAFEPGSDEQAMVRTCRPTNTVKGIDVSYYQRNIDWAAARDDGVVYAFIRVSDGSTFVDPRFQENWAGARAAGVKRGAYQFFRSNRDAVVQADLLLDQMGALQDGDLPPVLDVESTDGQTSATVRRKIKQWTDRVEARLGIKPIVYTGPYFWRDQVKGTDHAANPLWVAHYQTECPLVPEPWSSWTFHQYSDAGRVAGIAGNVDMNVFAGTVADLDAIAFHTDAPPPVTPTTPTTPVDTTGCAAVPASGGIIDELDGCFAIGGPPEYMLSVEGEGYNGLFLTYTTEAAEATTWGEWTINLERPGSYRLQVFTDTDVAQTRWARYHLEHDGLVETVHLDQHSANGFRELGTFTFASTRATLVLADNTGDRSTDNVQMVFDAVQVLPASTTTPEEPEPADACALVIVINADAVNIRPTPSTAQAAIGSVERGEVVTRLDSVEGQSVSGNRTWHHVQANGVQGYISSAYAACLE